MDIHKGLLSNWSKHLFLIFFIVLNSSCINNKNFVYYDGIYESPRHIPNTVFSDEMKLANDMANLNFEEATITTNKNQYREDYSTTNTYVYLNNNIDPYWNSRWEYRFWSLNNGWNGYGSHEDEQDDDDERSHDELSGWNERVSFLRKRSTTSGQRQC